jgi:lactate permease
VPFKLAFIANISGMSVTMTLALPGTGILFPFFFNIKGMALVFQTGSDISYNALFCKLKHTSTTAVEIDFVVTLVSNDS